MVFATIVFSRPYVNNTLLCTELFSSFLSLNAGLELLSKAPVRTDCLKLKADYPYCRTTLEAGKLAVTPRQCHIHLPWSWPLRQCSFSLGLTGAASALPLLPQYATLVSILLGPNEVLSCHHNNHLDNILTFYKANSF